METTEHINIPAKNKKEVLDLLSLLEGNFGFKLKDFKEPRPSDTDTPQIGWWIFLQNYPDYYFFYRVYGKSVYIKHYPNQNANKERSVKLVINLNAKPIDLVRKQALDWLKTINDTNRENKRWSNLFGENQHESSSQEFEKYDETELTPEEVSNIRVFLAEFDDLIQGSKNLPAEFKGDFKKVKSETDKKLDKKPTHKIFYWLKQSIHALAMKYITEESYREEVKTYFIKALDKVKNAGGYLIEQFNQLNN